MKSKIQLVHGLACLAFWLAPSPVQGQLTSYLFYRGYASGQEQYLVADILPYTGGFPTPPITTGTIYSSPNQTITIDCLKLPNGTESIGALALSGYPAMQCVEIPSSVTSIGVGAFASSGLTSIHIPGSVRFINVGAFGSCSNLTSATFEYGINILPAAMFAHCVNLASVALPDSVGAFEQNPALLGAFEDCPALKSITFPPGLTNIGFSAFRSSGLTQVTIPGGVGYVGAQAFESCRALATVTIEPGVRFLDYASFRGCTGMSTVTIPNTITNIGPYAFAGCTSLTRVNFEGDAPPDLETAFQDCPATIYYRIGANGWANAKAGVPMVALAPATFPEFSIELTNDGITINGYQGSATAVTIPGSMSGTPVTRIADQAFAQSAITSVTIGDAVTWIGARAFLNCAALTNVTFGKNVNLISISAFEGCAGLTQLSFPDRVALLLNYAFANCTSLTNVILSPALTSLDRTFAGCRALSSIYFKGGPPSTVGTGGSLTPTTTLYYPIGGSPDAWTAEFPGVPLQTWDPPSKFSVALADGNIAITGSVDANLRLSIPKQIAGHTVTSIAPFAFHDPNWSIITVPSTVTTLGQGAFSGCTSLTEVFFTGDAPTQLGPDVFAGTPATVVYDPEKAGWGPMGETFAGRPTGLWSAEAACKLTLTNGALIVTQYVGPKGAVIIPSPIGGYPVTAIGPGAFYYTPAVSVTLPATVTSLGERAFFAPSLTSIYFKGDAPTTIGDLVVASYATMYREFDRAGWDALSAQTPGGIGFWSSQVPCYLTLTNSQVFITKYLGSGGPVTMPALLAGYPVTRIANGAFSGSAISSVTIPDTVKILGARSFAGCASLTNVVIGNSVTNIDLGAFIECPLTSLTLPAGLITLGDLAVSGCEKLQSVYFKGNAPDLGGIHSFLATPSTLYRALTATGWGTVGDPFAFRPTALWSVQAPYSFTLKDGEAAISRYTSSESAATIPAFIEGYPVTSIAAGAFSGSSVKSVLIPASVTSIDPSAFKDSVQLTRVSFQGNAPTVLGDGLVGTEATLYYDPTTSGWNVNGTRFAGLPATPWPGLALSWSNLVEAQALTSTNGLQLWLKADAGVATNAAGAVVVWADQSGNYSHALQPNEALAPTLTPAALNGQPAVRFDGDNDYLDVVRATGLASTGDLTSFFVVQFEDFATYRAVWGKTVANLPASTDYYVTPEPDRIPRVYRGNGEASHIGYVDSTVRPQAGEFLILGFDMAGTTLTHYRDAQATGSGEITAILTDRGSSLKIGTRDDLFTKMKGHIAELLIYDRALPANERNSLVNYLQTKYGYANQPPVGGNRTLAIQRAAGNLVIDWAKGARLQESLNLQGLWTDVVGAASPYSVTPSNQQKFYRLIE